jgi:membrane protease YdiL (CAAX protease family)
MNREREREREGEGTGRALVEVLVACVLVTAAVAVVSATLPSRFVATAVGFVFLGATWAVAWRMDDARVRRFGLTLGGLVLPGSLELGPAVAAGARAAAWALGFAAVVFVPFYFGWRYWWAPRLTFHLSVPPTEALNEVAGQFIVIALPEEAFYRGYVQSRLDDVWAPRWRVAGANVGPGILVASAIFALGHMATIHQPARLAVFFPALLFGWLRARTGGIGAAVVFHALCNVFSEALGRGYGVY